MTNDTRAYATPAAFRQALETRLRRLAEEQGEELMRIRRQVAFDRLLARIFAAQDGPWALKGGYALQLRFAEARTTRDVDLSLQTPANLPPGSTIAKRLQEELQRLGNLDAADFFVFVVEPATGLYHAYYHEDRCHLSLNKDSPDARPVQARPSDDAEVIAIPRVGGIHHRYEWRDAA